MEDQKTVLVIPGSEFQQPLIAAARDRGHRVACADRDTNCKGAREADIFSAVGLDEPQRLYEFAKSVSACGVLTDQTDSGVRIAASLSSQLGTVGIGQASARLYTDKSLMRRFGQDHGFPTPQFHLCETENLAHTACNALGYPVVVKPTQSQSSLGVVVVHNPSQMRSSFAKAQRVARGQAVIVEQYIDGPEYTAEGYMTPFGHRTMAISAKTHYSHLPMVAQSLVYAHPTTTPEYRALAAANNAWVEASRLPFGMTHAEYKYQDGLFYLIEIAARGGGTRISSDVVPWVSGVDYLGMLLDSTLSESHCEVETDGTERCATLEFFDWPSGVVQSVSGLEAARSIEGVMRIELPYEPGSRIREIGDDTTRPGYFVAVSENSQHLAQIRNQLLTMIEVRVIE